MAEDMIGLQGELPLRTDKMEMAVAGAGRQLQLRLGIAAVDPGREWARGGHVITSRASERFQRLVDVLDLGRRSEQVADQLAPLLVVGRAAEVDRVVLHRVPAD